MSAAAARRFIERDDDPVDLGPADPTRYGDGARVWGFPREPKNAEERAAIEWQMSWPPEPVACPRCRCDRDSDAHRICIQAERAEARADNYDPDADW